ncbi:alpha-fucosidase [Streptococcus pneumoniae]|nr:alpha-fucosidase [Streptococcus pneumoniae]
MIRNKKQDYVLAYKQPASTTYMGWEEEALPIGNGSLGAKVFGRIGAERIQFNRLVRNLVHFIIDDGTN